MEMPKPTVDLDEIRGEYHEAAEDAAPKKKRKDQDAGDGDSGKDAGKKDKKKSNKDKRK